MLSIVATPIGNLGDITLRAIEMLKTCDAIVCEDTRVTGQLLHLLDLPKKPLISLHSYSANAKADEIIARLNRNEHICLVCDAGTPGISDPGFQLVSRVRDINIKMEIIPGPSAFLAALSVSGLPINQFVYLGFLPIKKGRQTLIKSFEQESRTIVFYESPHRIVKTLSELTNVMKGQPDRRIVIARELTKLHEHILSTTIGQLSEQSKRMTIKGEFVIVMEGSN